MKKPRPICCGLLLALAGTVLYAGPPGPAAASRTDTVVQTAGHKEGGPSASKPVGWRNDGTGVFPDSNPPLSWVPHTKWTAAKNIRWQTSLDGAWSNAQPIVVGKRVLAPLENLSLACLDADTAWRAKLTVAAWNPAARTARPSGMLANTG